MVHGDAKGLAFAFNIALDIGHGVAKGWAPASWSWRYRRRYRGKGREGVMEGLGVI